MKNSLHVLKWPLALLIAGLLIRNIGMMMKILHWVDPNPILITGGLIMTISILWLFLK